ncbi:AAA family ATPase [Candidatus Riflebacteria bacterium]
MLKAIEIENFKAFGKRVRIEFKNLTLISGLNGSGKSTIYQALLLLDQSKNHHFKEKDGSIVPYLNLEGEFIHFGVPKEILNNPRKKWLIFHLEFQNNIKIIYKYQVSRASKITLSQLKEKVFFLSQVTFFENGKKVFYVQKIGKGWYVEAESCLRFAFFEFQQYFVEEFLDILKKKKIELPKGKAAFPFCEKVVFDNIKSVNLRGSGLFGLEIPFCEILNTIKPEYRGYFKLEKIEKMAKERGLPSDIVIIVNSEWERWRSISILKNRVRFIPPFRDFPKRIYTRSGEPNPLNLYLSKMDDTIEFDFDFTENIPRKGTLEEGFAYWVEKEFKLAKKVFVEELVTNLVSEINFKRGEKIISIINMGFGTSQIIPVIFRILLSHKGIVLIVDEPEIHLHPSMQSKLADFFFTMALIGKKIIVETHSEYIIDRLIYLTLKYEDKKKYINLLWVKSDRKQTEVENIQYDELGYLLNPPEDFLSEKKKLVEELTRERMKKLEE